MIYPLIQANQAELRALGQRVNHKRIVRLMREAGIQGISRRRGYCVTTRRNRRERPAPDLVKRQFVATAPNQLWVAVFTWIESWYNPRRRHSAQGHQSPVEFEMQKSGHSPEAALPGLPAMCFPPVDNPDAMICK